MKPIWEINVMEGKNPIHTGSFLNSYDHRSFTPEEVVARESAQNAMDAGRNVKGITELEFHELYVSGADKKKLIDMFQFKEFLNPRIEAISHSDRNHHLGENLDKFLSSDRMRVLLIRDFNTCGLGGAWNKYNRHDHFGRLVCALNLDDKADDDDNSGGSFGLGKTAYAKSSAINTVLYHSTFKPTADSMKVGRRLMAAGIYPRHKIGETEFGGFAYFGQEEEPGKVSAKPFEDETAKEMWDEVEALFGVKTSRDDSKYGTDVLIFMSDLEMEGIIRAVEDYYFPAIISNQISIKFFGEDAEPKFPQPRTREDLDQFIRLYKDAKGTKNEITDTKRVGAPNRFRKHSIGRFAFEASEPHEAESEKKNCVALMRGTGMVINYLKTGSDQYEPAVGVFIAHEETWKYLVTSENAAHSEWNEHSRRLAQAFPSIGQTIVKRLNNFVYSEFRNFQKSLQPDVSQTRSESGLLAKLLSGALSGSSGDTPPPPGGPNPVSISLKRTRRESKRSVWRLLIEPNEYTPDESFILKLYPSISIAGDSKKVPIKHKEFSITDSGGKVLNKGRDRSEIQFDFSRDSQVDLTVEYDDPGKRNYIVQCRCIAVMETSQ